MLPAYTSVAWRLWIDQHVFNEDVIAGVGMDALRFVRPVYPIYETLKSGGCSMERQKCTPECKRPAVEQAIAAGNNSVVARK